MGAIRDAVAQIETSTLIWIVRAFYRRNLDLRIVANLLNRCAPCCFRAGSIFRIPPPSGDNEEAVAADAGFLRYRQPIRYPIAVFLLANDY